MAYTVNTDRSLIMAWIDDLRSKREAYLDRCVTARKRNDWGSVRLFKETIKELDSMIKHLEVKEDMK